jgi:hypothetical protein
MHEAVSRGMRQVQRGSRSADGISAGKAETALMIRSNADAPQTRWTRHLRRVSSLGEKATAGASPVVRQLSLRYLIQIE